MPKRARTFQIAGLSLRELTVATAAVGAGALLFESAIIPGLAIIGAAAVAPGLRRVLRGRKPRRPMSARRAQATAKRATAGGSSAIKQALAKTISYRVVVTCIDFTWNYVVLGEFAAAAGLSAVSLVAGPFFYFMHETAWSGFGASFLRKLGMWRTGGAHDDAQSQAAGSAPRGLFTIDKALAKTITFRTFATASEFTTNYVVVRDVGTAAALTAFGFFVGPFVYLGHEKIWEYYGGPHAEAKQRSPELLYSSSPQAL